ncbi:MAG TPA: hypothetical protein VJU77_12430 [Chthoniobacterales bacterium]|nr:hypothetical protein [Chthoniobacterales bacterium]
MKRFTTIAIWVAGSIPLAAFHASADRQSEGQLWAPTVIKESLSIPEAELPGLIKRAEAKDTDAALKLATYFGMYLGDTNKQIHFCEIAADNGSEKALHNLMMIFASFPEFFDFERALQVRARLKATVAAREGEMETDSEWAYDMYVEHFVGYSNKPRGLLFLEYAAKQGSDKARLELINIYTKDPDVRDQAKALQWRGGASSPKSAITPHGKN